MSTPYAEVIGEPIAHSKSPLIHRFWLEKLRLAGDYRATRVEPAMLGAHFASRRRDADWLGCNVTMPHKGNVLPLVDASDDLVQVIGSANTIVAASGSLTAFNTDTDGLVEALGPEGLGKSPVVLLGTGGAARTMLAVLRTQGLEEVAIIGRDPEKVRSLAARFGMRLVSPFSTDGTGGTAKLLVNSTPLGMTGFEPMPEALLEYVDLLGPHATVFDMVYAPVDTRLLSRARARGLRAIGGLDMLLGQADAAFRRFFAEPAPRQHDEELRMLLLQ